MSEEGSDLLIRNFWSIVVGGCGLVTPHRNVGTTCRRC